MVPCRVGCNSVRRYHTFVRALVDKSHQGYSYTRYIHKGSHRNCNCKLRNRLVRCTTYQGRKWSPVPGFSCRFTCFLPCGFWMDASLHCDGRLGSVSHSPVTSVQLVSYSQGLSGHVYGHDTYSVWRHIKHRRGFRCWDQTVRSSIVDLCVEHPLFHNWLLQFLDMIHQVSVDNCFDLFHTHNRLDYM